MKTKIHKNLSFVFIIIFILFLVFKNNNNCYVYAKPKQKTKIIKILNKKTNKNITKKKIINKPIKKTFYLRNMQKANIELPIGKNVVILNPGHGFEDSGATVLDPTQPQTTIKEKVLNAKITYELAIMLLKLKFDVYLIYDLQEYGLELPKNNPQLHILFKTKPKVTPNTKIFQISAHYIKEIMKKIKNANKNHKTVSVCLHHNHCGNGNSKSFGFISFYRNDRYVSENFANNSKNLAECFFKHCKNIYNVKRGINHSGVASNKKWLVCSFGSKNERTEKLFDSQAAVLLELGFMSNIEELKKILDDEHRKKMAKALSEALLEYYKTNKKNCITENKIVEKTDEVVKAEDDEAEEAEDDEAEDEETAKNTVVNAKTYTDKVIRTETVQKTDLVVKTD